MQWIPVSERLPNIGDIVLIFHTDFDGMEVAEYMIVAGEPYFEFDPDGPIGGLGIGSVTHWQPLPARPTKG